MRLKTRLRRLERGVEWLESEGRFRRIEIQLRILETLQKIADRQALDPAAAAQWKKDFPNFPCRLPPSSLPPAPAHSHPEERVARLEGCETTEVRVPTLRDSPLRGASQDEGVPNEGMPNEERPAESDVMPGMPTSPRPAELEMRHVHWRQRGAADDDDYPDPPGTHGRCIIS